MAEQLLIVAIVANRCVDDGARVIVDAENYRERHQQMIEQRAHKLAGEAKQTGKQLDSSAWDNAMIRARGQAAVYHLGGRGPQNTPGPRACPNRSRPCASGSTT